MAIKLRNLNTTKSLTPAELENYNYNLWIIEQGLNSVGAITPVPGGGSGGSSSGLSHHSLSDLSSYDDHGQYLYLAGRVGGQVLTELFPNQEDILTIFQNTLANRYVRIRGTGRLSTEAVVEINNNYATPELTLLVTGRTRFSYGGGSLTIQPNSLTVDFVGAGFGSGYTFDQKVTVTGSGAHVGNIVVPTTKTFQIVDGAGVNKVLTSDASGFGTWQLISTLTTRMVSEWRANGPYRIGTEVDGQLRIPTGFTITSVRLYRKTAGTGGSTIVDLNINGSTMFTTQGNRPTITAASGNNQASSGTLPDNITVNSGDVLSMDIDAVETGTPIDCVLIIEGS
jgi:hypothetical protein